MIPTASPATFTQNFGVPFADGNSMYEISKKSNYFFDYVDGGPTLYTKGNIAHAMLMYDKYIAKMREESDFASITGNSGTASIYPAYSMWHTSRISGADNIKLIVESFTNQIISIYSSLDISSFENIQASLKNMGFNKCAERIKYLRSDDAVEDGDEPISLESTQGFVKLMEDFQDLGEPLLGLFSQGTLGVEWRIADNKHLLVEPFDSESACFALIGPSTEREKRFRLNGRGSITDVIKTLRKEGVDQWQNI